MSEARYPHSSHNPVIPHSQHHQDLQSMAFFGNSSGFNISGGTFSNVERDQYNTSHNTTNSYQDSNNVHETSNYNSSNRKNHKMAFKDGRRSQYQQNNLNVNPQAQWNPAQSRSNEDQRHLARARGRSSPWVDQEDNDYSYPHPPASAPPFMIEENPRSSHSYPYPDESIGLVNDILAGQRRQKAVYDPAHSTHGYRYQPQQQEQYYEEGPGAHENDWQANAGRYRQQPAQSNVRAPQPQPQPQYRSKNPFNPFMNRGQNNVSAPPAVETDEDDMEGIEEGEDEEVVWDPRRR